MGYVEDDDDLERERPTLSFDGVNNVDMEALKDLDEAGLRAHFARVADAATASQLGAFLAGNEGPLESIGDEDKSLYARRFVDRRVVTVLAMRKARDGLRLPIDD